MSTSTAWWTASHSKYTALNAALWENGTFVYVPKNVEVALPLGAFTTADRGGLALGRTLVVVDTNAKLTYLDEYASDPFEGRLFSNAATEIVLKDGAKLRYVSLQNWSRNVAHIDRLRARLGRDARLESLSVSLGADAARAEVECLLEGPGRRERDARPLLRRPGGSTTTSTPGSTTPPITPAVDLLFKGALRDASSAVYSGLIMVDGGGAQDRRLPDQPQPAARRRQQGGIDPAARDRHQRRALLARLHHRPGARRPALLSDEPRPRPGGGRARAGYRFPLRGDEPRHAAEGGRIRRAGGCRPSWASRA